MWSSFEEICHLGEKIDPNKYFSFNSALNAYKTQIIDTNPHQQTAQQSQSPQDRPQQSSRPIPAQDSPTNPYQKQQQNIQNQILKQIDPQNDFLDQKHRQEIANMLRIVENDQQGQKDALSSGKVKSKQSLTGNEQTRYQHNCVHHSKHNQEQISVKVNYFSYCNTKSNDL